MKREKRPRVGRPNVDRSNKIRISVEITKPLKDRLQDEANERQILFSALVREILERYYEER